MGAGLQVGIVDLLSGFELAGTSKVGATIMRIHAELKFPTAVVTEWEYAIGVQPVTTVGTQLPNPNADTSLEWMIFKRVMATYSGATVDANFIEHVDNKSRRRIHQAGETLTLNLWAPAANAGTVDIFARVLLALP